MAVHKGSEGTVHVGTDAVAEIRSFTVDETADVIESTTLGNTSKTFEASTTSFSGSIDVFWDETDTAQIALSVGSSVTIKFYPEGASTGDKYYSGTAIVTGVSITANNDSLVEASISIQGSGALTLATA